MMRGENPWNMHLTQVRREYRWTTLRYMATADFHYQLAKIEGALRLAEKS